MRPSKAKEGGKGKGPAPKKIRKKPVPEVVLTESEDEMEPDYDVMAREDESSVDSNSSWEIDMSVTMTAEEEGQEVDDVDQVQVQLDANSEDEDDHTGLWKPEDLDSLIMALNHYRPQLKGKFFGCAGGKARRDKAWRTVAEYVNERCSVRWSVAQCKGKARRFADIVKHKFNALKREIYKTGGGEVDDDKYLSKVEEAMLDYVGVDSVVGLKGMHGSRLKRHHGSKHRKRLTQAAEIAWDPEREDRRSYLRLDTTKVKVTKKSKGVKVAKKKAK